MWYHSPGVRAHGGAALGPADVPICLLDSGLALQMPGEGVVGLGLRAPPPPALE